jgi:hypothetical protein
MHGARPLILFGVALLVCACGRRVELEDPTVDNGSAGTGGLSIDAGNERITPDGPVPVIDSGLSLEAGDGCAERFTGCPSVTDFPCGKTQWFAQLVDACREGAGCVEGFLTFRIEGVGCVSEIGMTQENRPFVDCLVAELNSERCPCLPSLEVIYLGEGCQLP